MSMHAQFHHGDSGGGGRMMFLTQRNIGRKKGGKRRANAETKTNRMLTQLPLSQAEPLRGVNEIVLGPRPKWRRRRCMMGRV